MKNRLTLISLLSLPLLFAGCKDGPNTLPPPPPDPKVAVALFGQNQQQATFEYSGTIQEHKTTSISFSVPGQAVQVLVDEGDTVRQGQLLAILDSTSQQETYQGNLAKLTQAQDAYNRLKPMYEQGAVSEVKFVEVQTGLAQATAMTNLAKKNLQDTKLVSPVQGIIIRKSLEMGQNVTPNTPVFTVIDPFYLDAVFAVPETEILHLHKGTPVQVSLPGHGQKASEAFVTEIAIKANEFSRSFPVRVRLKNQEGQLRLGMACHGQVKAPQSESTATLPLHAVLEKGDGSRYVFVVEQGKAQERPIQVIGFLGKELQIASGVNAGDLVVVQGMHRISHGTKVVFEREE